MFSGTVNLFGGMSEQDAHKQLKEALSQVDSIKNIIGSHTSVEVVTKWLFIDYLEWDVEFSDEIK